MYQNLRLILNEMPSCVAFGCTNSSGKDADKSLRFHRFPLNNPSLLAKWTSVIGRNNWNPTKQSRLCSDHFTPRDYKNPNSGNLKETAVPSKFKRLPSSRVKKTEFHSGSKETIDQDVPKAKSQPGRKSISQPTKETETAKKGKKVEKKRQPVKRKREEACECNLESSPENDDQEVEKIETDVKSEEYPSIDVKSEEYPSVSWSEPKSCEIQETVEPDVDQSGTKSNETKVKAKQTRSAPKSMKNKATPTVPKRPRSRKILRLSSDESDDDFEAMWASQRPVVTGGNVQIGTDEVLSAVRVELDENEISNDRRVVSIYKKWPDSGAGSNVVRATTSLTSPVPGGPNPVGYQQKPLCTIPADMDHVVAVNERRTRYRYIYRVGQCFPEEDDDVPFIKSKLNFVVKALESQSEKVRELQKKCRELARSNLTLKDILGIPSTERDELYEDEDLGPQQEAFLIVGSLPSSSASLPLYRFTLTDRSPTAIASANAK